MNYAAFTPEKRDYLDSILAILPGAVIAGGYVRDLLLNKDVRDMDILVGYEPTVEQLKAVEQLTGAVLYELNHEDMDEDYVKEEGRTDDIVKVFKDEFSNSLDIIVVTDVRQHIAEFPDNISRCWYDDKGIGHGPDFILGHFSKTIKYRLSAPQGRIDKLMTKFPDYRLEYV